MQKVSRGMKSISLRKTAAAAAAKHSCVQHLYPHAAEVWQRRLWLRRALHGLCSGRWLPSSSLQPRNTPLLVVKTSASNT